ncbi:phage major capsid protein [Rhodococcus fascians]|uniref:phage major capsid protein n=1 Tax=Rhodococcoides fascians TaxID=1828 RepID=UPI001C5FBCE4|nr:phage major capsid protein [Rhodococcus fascians]MBW4780481.1 phage major capsid protein [Rhodococcus fascians]
MKKTLQELRAEQTALEGEMRQLFQAAKEEARDLDEAETVRFDDAAERLDAVKAEIATGERRIEAMRNLADSGAIEHGTPGADPNAYEGRNLATNRGNTERDNAMRTIERGVKAKELPEHAAEKIETMLRDSGDTSLTARWAIAAGSADYRRAFAKIARDPERGHLEFTAAEAQSYRDVAQVSRAMQIGVDASGGYMVPLSLDPAILLTSNGSTNPLRQIARVVQITTSAWQGVSSAGVTAEWKAELAQASEVTPVLDDPRIPVYLGDAYTTYSFEMEDAGSQFLPELSKLLVDGADQLMNTAYTTGTGIGQPTGIVTALVAAGGSVIVPGSGTEALSAADAYALQGALGARFSGNAQFAGALSTQNTFRQFETGNGALKFPELSGNPAYLLGRRFHEVSNMDGTINAAATESNYPLIYGDFSNFVIVDRVGTRIEFIPNVMGANNRPVGARGALLWFRTGSDVVNPNAFRLLRVNTTA